MNTDIRSISCPDCGSYSRREFLKTTLAGTAAAATAVPLIGRAAGESANARSETLVSTLYGTLNEEQRKAVCFPFDHPLRSKVDNNWHITDKTLTAFFNKDQQAMIREIFVGLHSPEYAERV